MKQRFIGLVLLASFWTPVPVHASTVFIFVSDRKDVSCLPSAPTFVVQYLLTSKEIIEALGKYVRSEINPFHYDAAIVNAGIRFCGTDEKKKVFQALVGFLKEKNPGRRLFEVIVNYHKSDLLVMEIEREIEREIEAQPRQPGQPAHFLENLKKAKALILDHRKHPRSHPDLRLLDALKNR